MKTNELKNSKAITLIAMVVTIIVLLILAGVSIAVLTGENGILNRATSAKQTHEEKTEEEKLKLGVLALSTEYRSKTTHTSDEDKFSKFVNKEANKNKLAAELGISSFAIEIDTTNDILTYRTKQYKLDTLGGIGEYVPSFVGLSTAAGDAALPSGVTEVALANVANENLKDTTKLKAVIKGNTTTTGTGEVPIPINVKYKEGTEQTGVVIEYKGSEFVWVPVPVAVKTTNMPEGAKPMAKDATSQGYSSDSSEPNYEGILYDFSGLGTEIESSEKTVYGQGMTLYGMPAYREPDIVTYSDKKDKLSEIGFPNDETADDLFKNELVSDYTEMVKSVAKYGGFYVGRYETSLDNSTIVGSKESTSEITIMPMGGKSSDDWYGMYYKQKSFSTSGLISSMIWGSQYDAMLNWMLIGNEKTKVMEHSNGNHGSISVGVVGCGTYNNGSDKINNIYDLEGNVREWTLEAYEYQYRVVRGGNYMEAVSPNYRNTSEKPSQIDITVGTRLSLYIE